MGGKSGQVFRQILPVSDIAKIIAVHADIRLPAGDVQPALGHHAAQRHGLEGHGLASCVGPRYNDSSVIVSDLKILWNTGFPVHQGMPGLPQHNAPAGIDPGLGSPKIHAQLPL